MSCYSLTSKDGKKAVTIPLLLIASTLACSSPTDPGDAAGVVGGWRAVEWTVVNNENPSETIDGLRFVDSWELNLAADSAYDVAYRIVNQPGFVTEFGSFSQTAGEIWFNTSSARGQLSIAGRTFSFSLLDGVLTLEGPSTISAGLGWSFGFTPRTSQFLDFTTDNLIRLERR